MRKLAAFLVAPLIPALMVSVLAVVAGHADEIQLAILIGVCVGYPIAIVFGIPIDYFVFSEANNRNKWQVLLWTGAVTALLISVLFILDSRGPFGLQLAFSPSFWLYIPVFWASFFIAAWCFLKIAYGAPRQV